MFIQLYSYPNTVKRLISYMILSILFIFPLEVHFMSLTWCTIMQYNGPFCMWNKKCKFISFSEGLIRPFQMSISKQLNKKKVRMSQLFVIFVVVVDYIGHVVWFWFTNMKWLIRVICSLNRLVTLYVLWNRLHWLCYMFLIHFKEPTHHLLVNWPRLVTLCVIDSLKICFKFTKMIR